MDTSLDASSITAGTLFASNTYNVPQFQREYAWRSDEVDEFFDDLSRALQDDSYFLGLIIVTGEGSSKDIVDGQQRLITLTLLTSILHRQAETYERHALADRIRTTFLRSIDFATDEEVPRIKLSNERDNSTLQALISNEYTDSQNHDDQSVSALLLAAHETLEKKLSEDLKNEPFKRLGVWTEFLMNHLYVARFVHPDPGSAYRVFEVINTRGRELTTADLLKSYVLSQTNETNRGERYNEWQAIARSFPSDSSTSLVQFIRHAVTTSNGHVLPRDLYDVLTARGKSGGNPMSPAHLMALLQKHLPAYRQMMDPTTDGPATEAELKVYYILNALNVFSVRPILLALRNSSNPGDGARELLRLVMRRIVVGSLGTGNVERRFGQTAHRIAENDEWETALAALSDLSPARDEFCERAHHRSMNKTTLAVLRASILENTITPQNTRYLYMIMPRTADWSHENEDRVAYWVSTIGNSFLADTPRRPMNSSSWEGFQYSLLPLGVNHEWKEQIATQSEWGVDSIDTIGAELAARATEVWYD